MSRIAVAVAGVALIAAVQGPASAVWPAAPQSIPPRAIPPRAASARVTAVGGHAARTWLARVAAASAPRVAPSSRPTSKPSTKPSSKPSHKPSGRPKQSNQTQAPTPVAEMPGPTQDCPGTQALPRSSITQTPWAQNALDFSSVWGLSEGQGITVAVVDSGVDFNAQLRGRVTAFDLTSTGQGNPEWADCVGHGTAVAGIIAASNQQAEGFPFAGVAPAARILSVKVNSQESGSSALLAQGIVDAVIKGADVINVSICTGDSSQLRSAVEYAQHHNVVVVAAAGNDGSVDGDPFCGTAHGPYYPANYPGVLSVGSVGQTGALSSFSDTRTHVEVTAPGENITSAFPGGYQNDLNGTSFAAPFVSGVAALVRARYPRMPAAQVVARIEATADGTTGPGTGNGLVNPVQAVTAILGARSTRSIAPVAKPQRVSVSRTLPPDPTARTALAVAGGALMVAALAALGAVIIRYGRRRRWEAGRTQTPADGGAAGGRWPYGDPARRPGT